MNGDTFDRHFDRQLEEIRRTLSEAKDIVIAGHVSPDGDAVGSCLALAMTLKKQGKNVRTLLEPYNPKFQVIPGAELIYRGALDEVQADLFFCLDCGAPERLGAALAVHQRAPVTICVDHHDAALPFCQINAVDPDASSTSELVYLLIQPLAPLDKDVGTAIYAGIICDTGGFRHAASARTMRIASELLALGIPYTEIYNTLLKRHTLTEALVFRAALENLALASDGRIAHSRINAEALSGMNASGQDMDGVVEYLLNIQGTEAAALFYEKAPGEVKASLRSKELDIGAVARRFGGGGHKKAAGCTLTGEIKDISEKVLKALESALHAK